MNEKLRRILSWAKGVPAPPYFIEYRVTCKCNLNCQYCDRKVHDKGEPDFSMEEAIDMVRQAHELGVKEWDIVGFGEPMFNKEITVRLLEEIKSRGMFGTMTTNGTMFDEASIKQIVKSRWDGITISLDSHDAKIHDVMRGGKDAFYTISKNLKLFNKYKRQYCSVSPALNFQVVIHRKNFEELSRIIRLASSMGVRSVLYQPLIVLTEYAEKYRLKNGDIKRFQREIKIVKKLAETLGVKTNIGEYEDTGVILNSNNMELEINQESDKYAIKNPLLNLPCFEPWYMMAIRNEGSAVPCYHILESEENVRKKSLKEIWYGEYFNKVRERMMKRDFFIACKTCCPRTFIDNRNFRLNLVNIQADEFCFARKAKKMHLTHNV